MHSGEDISEAVLFVLLLEVITRLPVERSDIVLQGYFTVEGLKLREIDRIQLPFWKKKHCTDVSWLLRPGVSILKTPKVIES